MKTEIEHEKSGATSRCRFTIETVEDYELAKRRIDVLRASGTDSSVERELTALQNAVRCWNNEHDYLVRW